MRAMMIVNERGTTKLMKGEYIRRMPEGIIFKADYGWANTNDEKLYMFNEVVCVLDSNCKVIYGSLPEKYTPKSDFIITLSLKNNEESNIVLTIPANEPFSYCLDSGVYSINYAVIYSKEYGINYRGNLKQPQTFILNAGKDNCLGTITINDSTRSGKRIPFIWKKAMRSIFLPISSSMLYLSAASSVLNEIYSRSTFPSRESNAFSFIFSDKNRPPSSVLIKIQP